MLELRAKQLFRTIKRKDWEMAKINASLVGYELQRKFDDARNFVVTPLLSSGARERVRKGVAPFMFWDFGNYVQLTAESLREAAKHRQSSMIRWESRSQELGSDENPGSLDFDKETTLLNKWADILSIHDSDLMDEPYYKPYWDYISSSRSEVANRKDDGTPLSFRLVFPEETEEMRAIQRHLNQHEHAIHMLQVDILMELAENHRYMWD